MKRTTLIALILGAILVGGTFLGCSVSPGTAVPEQQPNRKQPPEVRVISASKQEISSILELTGSVEPYRLAQLASPAEGPVLDLSVREGDRVKAGDRLLSIGRKEGIAALVVSLREELKKEEDNLRRTRQLVEGDALPGEQLDQARASYEGVRAQLVKAEESALDYDIVAPWDGVISRLLVKEGDFVPPRGALLEMYDPYSLVIRAAVPERYAAEVRADMRVGVSLDAYPESALEGRIVRVYPYLDPHTRTRNMEIVLAGPIDLLPGMFARLKLRMKTAKDAVVVPTEAVATTTAGQHVVFVVEGGKASIRQVETGIEEGNRVQIVSGLNPGDKVVVAGNEALKDGDPVRLAGEEGVGKGKSTNAAGVPTEQDKKSEGGRP